MYYVNTQSYVLLVGRYFASFCLLYILLSYYRRKISTVANKCKYLSIKFAFHTSSEEIVIEPHTGTKLTCQIF